VSTKIPDTVTDKDSWVDLKELDEHGQDLTQWEADFVESLHGWLRAGKTLTERQRATLDRIRETGCDDLRGGEMTTTRHPLRLVRGTLVQLVGGPLHGERRVDDTLAEQEFVTFPVYRPPTPPTQGALPSPPPPTPPEVAVYARTAPGVYRHVEEKP